MKRSRHSSEEMYILIKEWDDSGTSKQSFCEGKGIPICVFDYWRRKQNLVKVEVEQGRGFSEVRAPEQSSGGLDCQLRLHYPDGRVLEFVSAPSMSLLRQILTW